MGQRHDIDASYLQVEKMAASFNSINVKKLEVLIRNAEKII